MTLGFTEPILALETSCDETSAAVLEGFSVRSNVVSSQIELHRKWGGVVPEAAARAHVEAILPVISEALSGAGLDWMGVRAVAVTNRPGLVGALSVGVTAAKGIARALGLPLIGVHHLEGHLLSPLVGWSSPVFPHVCLLVSGGHTEIVLLNAPGDYRILGQTRDDAAGEAFDKAGRLLGLGYPGGRAIQEAAQTGNPRAHRLPRGLEQEDTHDFSFSGLKTAVLRLVDSFGGVVPVANVAASVQEAIVSVLAERAVSSAISVGAGALTLAGGVAANSALRERLFALCTQEGLAFQPAPLDLCTDNAAMIGLAGAFRLGRGERSGWDLDVLPNDDLPRTDF